jgi:hypothetical protein
MNDLSAGRVKDPRGGTPTGVKKPAAADAGRAGG